MTWEDEIKTERRKKELQVSMVRQAEVIANDTLDLMPVESLEYVASLPLNVIAALIRNTDAIAEVYKNGARRRVMEFWQKELNDKSVKNST